MPSRPFGVSLILFAQLSLGLIVAQENRDGKKGKGAHDETGKMFKLVEKAYKKPETERDKVIKEISKHAANGMPLDPEPSVWFDLLSQGQPQWDRSSIAHKGLAEVFDRIADRMQIATGKINREQFVRYGRQFWRDGDSPLWKEGKEFDLPGEAEKLFRHLDRDGNGRLTGDEMPEALRGEWDRWDRNRDGAIDLEEYFAYFGSRLQRLDVEYRDQMAKATLSPEPVPALPETERPMVPRPGKLPPGLPDWFERLDTDRDGQIALHEWRGAGWSVADFQLLDLNDDGLLEPRELLQQLSLAKRDGSRPFAYLLDKKLDGKGGADRKAGKFAKR